jgi:hypothetical protein
MHDDLQPVAKGREGGKMNGWGDGLCAVIAARRLPMHSRTEWTSKPAVSFTDAFNRLCALLADDICRAEFPKTLRDTMCEAPHGT